MKNILLSFKIKVQPTWWLSLENITETIARMSAENVNKLDNMRTSFQNHFQFKTVLLNLILNEHFA